MKKFFEGIVALTFVCVALVGNANASILTFDDVAVSGDNSEQLGSYGGFSWTNMYVLNADEYIGGASGYNGGRVSGTNVAFNGFAVQATAASGTFDFNSAYLAAAWNNGLSVRVQGFLNGNLLYDTTVQLLNASATPGAGSQQFVFNYVGINQLVFNSFGGTDAGFNGGGEHFAMDNFEFNATNAIPEPGSLLVWGVLGLAGVGMTNRRRKS
jgi:hypothetical protein